MGEREWSDAVLMVNGQPVRVVPEVDFGGDIPVSYTHLTLPTT